MGRKQKTLSNVSSTKAPVHLSHKGLHHQSKMVLLPCYSHQSMPSINEDSLPRAKIYQTRAKLSVNPHHRCMTIPSSHHKEDTAMLLPHIEHEAVLPHLENQATIIPSSNLKHWGKTTVIASPCPEFWATPLFGLNHWTQTPLIHESLLKTSSGPDHLPKIPQGCHNPVEAQPLLNNWPTSSSSSFPDPKTKTTAIYSQIPHYQAKMTTETLPCLNPQPSLSSRHWDWATASRLRCLNPRQKIAGIPFSCSNNYPKITTMLSSQPSHQIRPITVPPASPPISLAPLAMTLLTTVPNHQARVTAVPPNHDPNWCRAISMPLQCPITHLAESPLIPHYNFVRKTSKLPDQQPPFPTGSYNISKILLVPDQQAKSSVGPDCPTEVLHLNYWVTPQPGPDQKVDTPPNPENKDNLSADVNQETETPPDVSSQHEPKPGPQNEDKKQLDPDLETPEILLNHSDKALLDLNHKETPSPTPSSQPEAPSGTNDKGETTSDCDHQDEVEPDLDHRTKDILDSNQDVKASPDSDIWVQIIPDLELQATPSLSLGQTDKDEDDPDHQDQPKPISSKLEWIIADHGTFSGSDHPPEANPAAEHQDVLRLSSNHQAGYTATSPTDVGKKSKNTPDPDKQHTLSPGSDHWTSPLNQNDQVKDTSNPQNPVDAVSPSFNPKTQEIQGESSKPFTHIRSVHITDGSKIISKDFFTNIINSIPREKIKNDIQKQILLRRMRGYHNTQPGSYLSSSYTICLICASWIPYGCPHVNGTKDPCGAQLMVMPTPMPNSKDEMGIKYILQVPQSKTGTIWDSSHFISPTSSSCPHSLSQTNHQLPKRMTWLDFILAKGDESCGRKTFGNQQQFQEKMSMNFSTPTQGASRNEDVVRCLLDRFKHKRIAN